MSDTKFGRLANEVVSGGTQRPAEPGASLGAAVGGGIAWVALLVYLALVSPWMLVFVIGLAVSIMLHELGHFWTARRSGMKATQFFLGFGPRVWSVHRNGVEYGLRAIPLGGFVKIVGMTNLDEVAEGDEPYTYREATYPRRMWVITAGSVMHMIIALAIVTGVYATWGRVEETGRVMISDVEPGTPAAQAGMSPDDVVLAIDGRPTATSTEFRATLASFTPGSAHRFSIDREGTTVELTATLVAHPDFPDEQRGYLGVRSFSADRVQQPLTDVIVEGPRDLAVALGQATVGVVKVLNPVNVWGHLTGTNDDPTTRPGTIIGATRLSDDAGEFEGWPGVLFMLAAVNVSVGVFNMFPLLPLDGGHAVIATYERLRSRGGRRYRADISKMMPIAAISIALLAFMFLTGLYLDTVKF